MGYQDLDKGWHQGLDIVKEGEGGSGGAYAGLVRKRKLGPAAAVGLHGWKPYDQLWVQIAVLA